MRGRSRHPEEEFHRCLPLERPRRRSRPAGSSDTGLTRSPSAATRSISNPPSFRVMHAKSRARSNGRRSRASDERRLHFDPRCRCCRSTPIERDESFHRPEDASSSRPKKSSGSFSIDQRRRRKKGDGRCAAAPAVPYCHAKSRLRVVRETARLVLVVTSSIHTIAESATAARPSRREHHS